ncbi:hypothetical protein YC2023_042267 [Brassica napus]
MFFTLSSLAIEKSIGFNLSQPYFRLDLSLKIMFLDKKLGFVYIEINFNREEKLHRFRSRSRAEYSPFFRKPRTDEHDEAHRIHCFFYGLPLVPRALPCYSDFIISPNQSVTLELTKSTEKIDRINCSCSPTAYSILPLLPTATKSTEP